MTHGNDHMKWTCLEVQCALACHDRKSGMVDGNRVASGPLETPFVTRTSMIGLLENHDCGTEQRCPCSVPIDKST